MEYVPLAKTADFKDTNKIRVTHGKKEIMIARIGGEYYAISNTCPHMGGSLVQGKLDGYNIVCPVHGSVFDVRDGKVVGKGKLFLMQVKVGDVAAYPVKADGEDILVGVE